MSADVPLVIEIDPADEGWERAVAEEWKSSWSDPREDIYTLEDGEAVDGIVPPDLKPNL